MISRVVLLGSIALIGVRDARAQSVPAAAIDFNVGGGAASSRAGDVYFRNSYHGMIAADLTVRLGGSGATRPVIVVGYSSGTLAGDQLTDCPTAPNGGCRRYFPQTYGAMVGLGLRHAMGDRFMVGVTAGVASFSNQAEFADVEASVKLFSHFALLGKFAYFTMPFAGERVWFTPLAFGARLLW